LTLLNGTIAPERAAELGYHPDDRHDQEDTGTDRNAFAAAEEARNRHESTPTRFEIGDRVAVDWSAGEGPVETFTGEVVSIADHYEPTVTVRCDPGTYPDVSVYGPKHDCAPAWLTPLPTDEQLAAAEPDRSADDATDDEQTPSDDPDETPMSTPNSNTDTTTADAPITSNDESDAEPESTIRRFEAGDELPSNESVLLITGITRITHTPETIEGETSGTGKTIAVSKPHCEDSTVRLDTEAILSGESEFRDSDISRSTRRNGSKSDSGRIDSQGHRPAPTA